MTEDTKDKLKVVSINKDLDQEPEGFICQPDEAVISYLETLLEQAKEGAITEIITVVNYYEGVKQSGTWVGEDTNPDGMVGSLQRTSLRYQMWCDGFIFDDEE